MFTLKSLVSRRARNVRGRRYLCAGLNIRSPVEIPVADVVTGRFIHGAHRMVTETGVEYEGLTVRRRDIATAITLLKRIQFGTKHRL